MVKKKGKSGKGKNKLKGGGGSGNTSTASGGGSGQVASSAAGGNANTNASANNENLDTLDWLRECDKRRDIDGEAWLQLEYQDDDELMLTLKRFLETSTATKSLIDDLYQIWQQTVLSTLLASSALWKKENVQSQDQRLMKDQLKTARYKINFIMHHCVGSMLSSSITKWKDRQSDLLQLCYQTLQLLPRLAESCPHHKTDIRATIIHFEGKEFLAAVACETWDTLYDYSIPINPSKFIPILRRCAMLDILDKDWNMLGGWEDILKGLEAKCCVMTGPVMRLPCDTLLHEHTTILRNARNSMQCKFFSVRFMRYTEDQAPQRWRYFPKCSAPACSNIETSSNPHPFRCPNCWYFHYCSESCQEYCDSIMGLHPKFCQDTPTSKAQLCQLETEQYLGWNISSHYDNNESNSNKTKRDLLCHACGTLENNTDVMKRCSKCHIVHYCSRQCQEWDWRIGGHKVACKKTTTTTTTANSNNNANSNATDDSAGVTVEEESGTTTPASASSPTENGTDAATTAPHVKELN